MPGQPGFTVLVGRSAGAIALGLGAASVRAAASRGVRCERELVGGIGAALVRDGQGLGPQALAQDGVDVAEGQPRGLAGDAGPDADGWLTGTVASPGRG